MHECPLQSHVKLSAKLNPFTEANTLRIKIMPHSLFHYTSEEGYNAIMRNPQNWFDTLIRIFRTVEPDKIRPSLRANGDSYYGDGWYFTDMAPTQYSRKQIAQALWAQSFARYMYKTSHYIEVQFHGNTSVVKCRSHVFLVPLRSTANQNMTSHGAHPEIMMATIS